MKEKLSKIKDILVIAVSFEVNTILTLVLFGAGISEHLWTILKVNFVALLLYAWLWFIEFYLANYSTSAMMEKKIRLKELEIEANKGNSKPAPEYKPEPELKKVKEEIEKIEVKEEENIKKPESALTKTFDGSLSLSFEENKEDDANTIDDSDLPW